MKKKGLTCIIDDDPIYIFGAKKTISKMDISTDFLIFNEATSALEYFKNKDNYDTLPSIILLDLNMPIIDGWQFLDEFITYPIDSKITIFIVTSSVDPSDVEKAESYEAVSNYIIKPITFDKLETIKHYL